MLLKLLKRSTTLLASKIEINPNPETGEHYLFLEGNKVGFIPWLLKKLGLMDPSVKISVDDKLITRVDGGKQYTVAPTASVYGFSAGYSNKKRLLVQAILALVFGIFFGISIHISVLIVGILLALVFFWLYKRSGALSMSLSCYKDGFGADLRVKSGLTGKKLNKSDFENVFNALRNVSQANSQFYK